MEKKRIERVRTTSSSTEISEKQLQSTVGRVLQSTFKEPSESTLYLRETASHLKQHTDISIRDLTSNAIMEILLMIKTGRSVKKTVISTILL